jgi:hypothetical protein
LVLILIGVVILILVLLYIARRNEIGVTHTAAACVPYRRLVATYSVDTPRLYWL